MKKIAILVIAATSQPVYIHYINKYWTELIRYTNADVPHIDVFLLFENSTDLSEFSHLKNNIIVDPLSDYNLLCPPEYQTGMIPGVLSKTVHALELLQDHYDVFFRTNLSSLIRVSQFDHFVQNKKDLVYSGTWVWNDGLRKDLQNHNRIGPDKSIKSLSELDEYPGNSFISGSGYFLNADEVRSLIRRKHQIRYDIIDDVSMGLMFSEYEVLRGFSLTLKQSQSLSEMKSSIRKSTAPHVRIVHFPLDRARALWREMEQGQLWKSLRVDNVAPIYSIYFQLFDHIESQSSEIRMTLEGLEDHSQVNLEEDPEVADYLIFCQNHLVEHCQFHERFRPIKDKYRYKSIMLDYGDSCDFIYDQHDFDWKLYFKRSCVDRKKMQAMDYGDLEVLPTAYGVTDDMVEPPQDYDGTRNIAVSCLFNDNIAEGSGFKGARARLLKFAKALDDKYEFPMQVGTVSECGPTGRSGMNAQYKSCLFDSKIILHANPNNWEGDSRTWEAISSGALVFIDRMIQPIEYPLVDGVHVIFYDLTETGKKDLEKNIIYYLQHDDDREEIARQGREFVLGHHRAIHRINTVMEELQGLRELAVLTENERQRERFRSGEMPDIIVTIATGYSNIDQYRQFISTLRRTGADCPVFIGIYDGPEYENVKKYLLENAINTFIVPSTSPEMEVVNGYRFEHYRQWLGDLEFRYALLMDFRDTYFQRDPFEYVEGYMQGCDLYLMSEFKYLTSGNHPNGLSYGWVMDTFGKKVADSIADEPFLNSGAIMGNKAALMTFLEEISSMKSKLNFEFADHGALNYLAHSGRLSQCGRIKIVRAGRSIVNHCGFAEIDLLQENRPFTRDEEQSFEFIPRDEKGRLKLYRDDDGWVLDDDGKRSNAVRQYERFMPEMGQFVSELSCYEHPDDVFVQNFDDRYRADNRYRAEKFILICRALLQPSVIQRLITKIKQLPVDKKPLLVVNRRFKHSFVFAYGILHNDLRFESESFRQAFAQETDNPVLCDEFCQRWGYRPVSIGEEEVFEIGAGWVDPVVLTIPALGTNRSGR